MSDTRLSKQALNRATLARQLLLAREPLDVVTAVERVGGLQAQLPRPPFVALWTRLAGFERGALLDAARARQVVRATLMRGTLHLVTAADYVRFRPGLGAALAAGMHAILRDRVAELDEAATVAAARGPLGERPHTFEELRAILVERFPAVDERALGYAVRMLLPLVQVPDDALAWGWQPGPAFALAEQWLGTPIPAEDDASLRALALRYLGAFGPATAADAQAWSGVRGLRATLGAMRDELVTFRDERKRELFDLPDAPRPGPDVAAPPRFLPEFDSLVLAHDDRTRVIDDAHRPRVVSKNLQVAATFLVDGVVSGTWKVVRTRGVATLTATPFGKVPAAARKALDAEGQALLRFVEPDAKGYEVHFDTV